MEILKKIKEELAKLPSAGHFNTEKRGRFLKETRRMINNIREEGYVGGESGVSEQGLEQTLKTLYKHFPELKN